MKKEYSGKHWTTYISVNQPIWMPYERKNALFTFKIHFSDEMTWCFTIDAREIWHWGSNVNIGAFLLVSLLGFWKISLILEGVLVGARFKIVIFIWFQHFTFHTEFKYVTLYDSLFCFTLHCDFFSYRSFWHILPLKTHTAINGNTRIVLWIFVLYSLVYFLLSLLLLCSKKFINNDELHIMPTKRKRDKHCLIGYWPGKLCRNILMPGRVYWTKLIAACKTESDIVDSVDWNSLGRLCPCLSDFEYDHQK